VVRTLLLGQQQEEQQQQQKQKQKQQSSSGNNGPSKDRQDLLPSLSSLPRQKNLGRGSSSSSSSKQIVVDATDDFGETALHKASEAGHIAVVKLLLAHGSDPRCTNAR
jgi:ankyrin repeat protein